MRGVAFRKERNEHEWNWSDVRRSALASVGLKEQWKLDEIYDSAHNAPGPVSVAN